MNSIHCLCKNEIQQIFNYTDEFIETQGKKVVTINNVPIDYSNKILCNVFFEPSTRTSMSFETAMIKLGGNVTAFHSISSSLKKGETFEDTMKTIQEFCDIIVLRHPKIENIYEASKICKTPIINGGNGSGEHPTQALLDLYTIRQYIDITKLFNICFIGDIKYSRTIHSLIDILEHLNIICDITFCCYPNCEPDEQYIQSLYKIFGKNNIHFISSIETNINNYDVFYSTRNQSERHNNSCNYDISNWQINENNLKMMKSTAIILHPLPRNDEITITVDNDKRAKYFTQVANGVYIRMAILHFILQRY